MLEYEVSGELEAATEVLAMDERSTVVCYKYVSGGIDRAGSAGLTLRIGIGEDPLPELSRVEDILDTDAARGPIAGLLVCLRAGEVPRGGKGHVGDLVLGFCLVGRVFILLYKLCRGGVCQDRPPGVGAGPILLNSLVEA